MNEQPTDFIGQHKLLQPDGPVCLIITAQLSPIAGMKRFQPAGFPEVGHVIYDAPGRNGTLDRVCIVDSPASMANHLETVCLAGSGDIALHADIQGLPYVVCVTDRNSNGQSKADPNGPRDRTVASTFTEGHRLASDYFLDGHRMLNGHPEDDTFRDLLRREFKIIEVKKDKTYFIPPETWWSIYQTVFHYDPNSLVHGVMFAKEQIKISRLLTAHLEASGAKRVGRSGVKFDRLGKTTSGQPIFSVDEETATEIRATFILDLALLRSYGRGSNGLNDKQKRLVLELALWKIARLLNRPFRYRTQCHLMCENVTVSTESQSTIASDLPNTQIASSIQACNLRSDPITRVYYPAAALFKPSREEEGGPGEVAEEGEEVSEAEEQ